MHCSREVAVLLSLLVSILIAACQGNSAESHGHFARFVRAVDPQNNLNLSWNGEALPHPCNQTKNSFVRCDSDGVVTEVRLENLNLSGKFDADSLCKLPGLQVLSLARNSIHGYIPDSISSCRNLMYLNLSSNLLRGRLALVLKNLNHVRIVDISRNNFTGSLPKISLAFGDRGTGLSIKLSSTSSEASGSPESEPQKGSAGTLEKILPVALGIAVIICVYFLAYFVRKRVLKMSEEKKLIKMLSMSPAKTSPPSMQLCPTQVNPEEETNKSELVFFVEDKERFDLGELLESAAHLQSQTICSSLYKVILNDCAIYAVKRLKKLQVSFDEFGAVMRRVGKLKHPNILPLIAFSSNHEEKLLIYKYQTNGNLSNILDGSIDGKREFPWKLRLSIASGIAKGLNYIYNHQNPVPHGNLKPSNILLDDNDEPLISEYGYAKYRDPKISTMFSSNGYSAPEKEASEKGDVYSFGIILLELLTGKTVEKSGIDLPKWVRSMVREEWTGEVFDRRITNPARDQYGFHLLDIALKCVSGKPEDRPTMAVVVEKIEEVASANDDVSISSLASADQFSPKDCCLLHSMIPETWDTPGSNY
ncbi:unnamed protein product [Linum tenue]|uniref:Protein kinase domain-containing protein n=6 Tax=Linum tenue TaxID=586396 RepID=A0AAV0H456_9ROSI|nr:unnamed protein product [Linum tenue]